MRARERILGSLGMVAAFILSTVLQGQGALHAQACPDPDGLNGLCWQQVLENLPQFPTVSLPASGICWGNCTPVPKVPLVATLTAPARIQCAVYTSTITVSDAAAVPQLTGTVRLDYTRTWLETDSNGVPYQVWRFLAKVALTGLAPPGCPVPSCTPTFQPFFYGYLDYAKPCASVTWSNALVLFHNCDFFIHNPLISSQPGAFHPATTYAIVAPDTAANPFMPFVPATVPVPPAGPLVAEAVRNVPAPGALACTAEEPISVGTLSPIVQACVCMLNLALAQVTAQNFLGRGVCTDATGTPSGFASIDTFSLGLPWLHLMTTSIGCWTTSATYPGKECAFVTEGVVFYHDSCRAVALSPSNFVHVNYGAETTDGWMVVPSPGVMLTQKFIDVASNYSAILPGPITPPFVGGVLPTVHLIYGNVP